MNVFRYLVRRVLYAVPILMGVLMLLFIIFFAVTKPMDMARKAKGEKAPPEVLEAWVQLHGYDKPKFPSWKDPKNSILVDHFSRMLTLHFGNSDADDQPIARKILKGAGPSLMLATPSFLLSTFFAVSLALFVAFFRGTSIDYAGAFLCVLSMSIVILIYILLGQFVLSKTLMIFPISGYERGDGWRFVVLPLIIGLVAGLGGSVRFYRTIMVEEMTKDYVRTARAKGVSDAGIMFGHVLKNAMIPILTQVVMAVPYLFLGSLLMESFFSIPGLGSMTKDAIDANDFATLRAMVFIGSILFIVGQTATDVCYSIVDPRVRLE